MVDHVILVQGYSCLSEELYIDKTSCTQLSDLASIPHTQVECLTDSPHQGMPGHIREEQNHFGEAPAQRAALLFWPSPSGDVRRSSVQFSSVQSLSRVRLFTTP